MSGCTAGSEIRGGGQEGRFDGFAYVEESDVIWKIFGLLCCMQELILTKICGSESAEMGLIDRLSVSR